MNEWITYAYLPAFARALAALVRRGTPLREALQALGGLQGDADAGEWPAALASLGEAVEEGALLSAAMQQRPNVFPGMLVALVRAGEVSSTLDACLERYVEYARAEHALCGGRTPERLEPALETALWCRRMHLLLTSGVPILQSMEVSVQPPASDLLREAVLIARAGVREGQPLKTSLKDFPHLFPPFVCQFLLLGEETGTLDSALLWAADFLERSRQLPPPDVRGVPAAVTPPPPARAAGAEEAPPHERAEASDTSTETPPVIRVANAIICQALKERASDIHIEPDARIVRVRYRVDGVLREVMQLPDYILGPLVARLKLMAGLAAAERGAPQRGQIEVAFAGRHQSLRLQTYPFAEGEGVALHIASRPEPFTDLASLGMLPEQAALCERLLRQPCGVLAVAGPHGSGRTTTLHTLLRLLRRGEASLAALEDPIEETLEGVKQIAVGPAQGLTYAEGIRGLMHQDPDVIGVGDVRDAETAVEVAHAAAGGHLLLVGIAATDAAHALERLVRLDPEGMPGQVIGVIGQRLVRTPCPRCRGEATCGPEDADGCRGAGALGRTGVFEILEVGSVEMRKQVHAGAFRTALRQRAAEEGMVTLAQAAAQKVRDGVISDAEVRRAL